LHFRIPLQPGSIAAISLESNLLVSIGGVFALEQKLHELLVLNIAERATRPRRREAAGGHSRLSASGQILRLSPAANRQ
jgi:hypothetical protein